MKTPHADPGRQVSREAPNAALLIDFDNVTMGMRSDLAKELKNLLDSDIIKGKVTVQRAYADWRRYPQYIVPLSEASIDLIFAPAYGSSKKNATDIRMAIDGIELVFIRPEIGTFILLTGDSDFSSLVLKLKEYGKYVIGIGIQESSSDILVQNCDEYYSYTALTGLSRTSEHATGAPDAWQCVEEAVAQMASRGDVMRSDRLKQVIMEMSPSFDERNLGYKKFSKFLVEAANRGLLNIERGENGQYHIAPRGDASAQKGPVEQSSEAAGNGEQSRRRARRSPPARRQAGRGSRGTDPRGGNRAQAVREPPATQPGRPVKDPAPSLDLLKRAVVEVGGKQPGRVRDSDVKRRMLAIDRNFSEAAHGFGKFSKFLRYAEKQGVVRLERAKDGSYGIALVEPRRESVAIPFDPKALGLPVTEGSIKSYLANRYKGVGVKTAERLVEAFGAEVFSVLHREPDRVRKAVRARANSVMAAWEGDYKRRSAALARSRSADGSGQSANTSPTSGRKPGGATGTSTGQAPATRPGSSSSPGSSSRPTRGSSDAPSGDADRAAAMVDPGKAASDDGKPARSGLMGLFRRGRRSREGAGRQR
ncbi:MAG: NYN domain-containing protein [Gemmatimonadota bacterium]|nr:NYN domain-containing protein [Gemmatimonadota bacterium]